jgi:hypothetical protein
MKKKIKRISIISGAYMYLQYLCKYSAKFQIPALNIHCMISDHHFFVRSNMYNSPNGTWRVMWAVAITWHLVWSVINLNFSHFNHLLQNFWTKLDRDGPWKEEIQNLLKFPLLQNVSSLSPSPCRNNFIGTNLNFLFPRTIPVKFGSKVLQKMIKMWKV